LITYDTDGRVTLDVYGIDYDGDLVYDETTARSYTYDADGNLTEEYYVEDWDADEAPDSIEVWTFGYDAEGRVTSQIYEWDADGDGTLGYMEDIVYTFDVDGNLVGWEWSGYESDADGEMDDVADSTGSYMYTYAACDEEGTAT
jgi:hypothetical protein